VSVSLLRSLASATVAVIWAAGTALAEPAAPSLGGTLNFGPAMELDRLAGAPGLDSAGHWVPPRPDAAKVFLSPPVVVDGFSLAVVQPPQAPASEAIPDARQELALGGRYATELNGVGFELGCLYLRGPEGDDSWRFGASLAWHGMRLGVRLDRDAADEGSLLGFDLGYDVGAWSFSSGWSAPVQGAGPGNFGLWASYTPVPGVTGMLGYQAVPAEDVQHYDSTVIGYLRIGF
jgi:hypothetical protein